MKPGTVAFPILVIAMLAGCGNAESIDDAGRAAENERRDDEWDARAAGAREDRQAADHAYARDQDAKAAAKIEAEKSTAGEATPDQ